MALGGFDDREEMEAVGRKRNRVCYGIDKCMRIDASPLPDLGRMRKLARGPTDVHECLVVWNATDRQRTISDGGKLRLTAPNGLTTRARRA